MHTPEDISKRLQERPFQPFRLITSSGQAYDIVHPDLVLVGRRSLTIGTASVENPKHYDVISQVAMLHISDLQNLPVTASPSGNGPA